MLAISARVLKQSFKHEADGCSVALATAHATRTEAEGYRQVVWRISRGLRPCGDESPTSQEKNTKKKHENILKRVTLVGQARAARSKEAGPRKLAQRKNK